MFFHVSKIISALIWPSNVVAILLVAGVILTGIGRGGAWGRRLTVAAAVLLGAFGFSPIGNWLVLPLEQRFARGELPERLTGIIILGGFEVPGVGNARGDLSLNDAAERLTESLRLAFLHPEARVIFTGGAATFLNTEDSAAESVSRYLQAVGIAPARIVLESQSRNTHENALYLAKILAPKLGDRFALVTSAFHMPRSMGTFRQQGFDVVPWPVDYRTRGWQDAWTLFPNPPEGLGRVDFAFKEWVGLVAYRLSGRSNEFWPGPGPGARPARPSPLPSAAGQQVAPLR